MKKVLLVVGLVVMFFAQSSYADKVERFKGIKTNFTYEKNTSYYANGSIMWESLYIYLEDSYWDSKLRAASKVYEQKVSGEAHPFNCFDINSRTYFNVDRCNQLSFVVHSRVKKEPENTKRVKKFVGDIARDFCEDPYIQFRSKIKKGNWAIAGDTLVTITCDNVIAIKKKKEEEKRKAKKEEEKRKAKKEEEKNKEKQKQDIDNSKIVAASSGTGFFVSTNGHMVTNNHVIDSCDNIQAHYKGKIIDTDVLFVDRTNDLAIIKANIKPEKVFPVSNDDVSLLEDIIVAGYPLGKNISSSIKTFKGSVTALAGFGDNYSNFQIDASLSSGNSGGPIINQKGNVVGVAVEKYVEVGVEGFNFGVKSSTLKTFASSNQIKFVPASTEELSNKELGQLITEATIYLECWMSVAKIKQIIQEGERQKAFFSEYK